MTPEREEELLAADTAAYGVPIVLRHLPKAIVETDLFDLHVTVRHAAGEEIKPGAAYAIARELRGNRPIEKNNADWHVRAIEPLSYHSDQGDHPREGEVIGTQIWLSQTYYPPAGYNEEAVRLSA